MKQLINSPRLIFHLETHKSSVFHKIHRRYTFLATKVENGCQLQTGGIIGLHNVLDKAEGRER